MVGAGSVDGSLRLNLGGGYYKGEGSTAGGASLNLSFVVSESLGSKARERAVVGKYLPLHTW